MAVKGTLPILDWITLRRNDAAYRLPYCFRKGNGGPALLFVHGLGGAKENFYAAFQSLALADCDLLAFDFPGTGLAEFDPRTCPDVNMLAELVHLVWKALLSKPVFLVVASMGGLIGLLMIRKYGSAGIEGLVNIEGNLAPEDCMFSRRVTSHTFDEFSKSVFRQIQSELRASKFPATT